jgi:hypothetical protein
MNKHFLINPKSIFPLGNSCMFQCSNTIQLPSFIFSLVLSFSCLLSPSLLGSYLQFLLSLHPLVVFPHAPCLSCSLTTVSQTQVLMFPIICCSRLPSSDALVSWLFKLYYCTVTNSSSCISPVLLVSFICRPILLSGGADGSNSESFWMATAPYFYGSILLRALKSKIIVLLTYVFKK